MVEAWEAGGATTALAPAPPPPATAPAPAAPPVAAAPPAPTVDPAPAQTGHGAVDEGSSTAPNQPDGAGIQTPYDPAYGGTGAGGGTDTGPGGSTAPDGADGSVTYTTEQAYKPAGIVAMWRQFIDVFRVTVPNNANAVQATADSLKGIFQ